MQESLPDVGRPNLARMSQLLSRSRFPLESPVYPYCGMRSESARQPAYKHNVNSCLTARQFRCEVMDVIRLGASSSVAPMTDHL